MTSYINGDAGNQERSSRWRFLFETGEMMLLNNEPDNIKKIYILSMNLNIKLNPIEVHNLPWAQIYRILRIRNTIAPSTS